MKKMKRLLVAILSGLTAIACIAGVSACKNSADKGSEDKAPVESVVPDTNININMGGQQDPTLGCAHEYTEVYTKAATCEEEGLSVVGCSKCGKQLEVEATIPELGHTYTLVDSKDPTCTEAGYEFYIKCATCDQVFMPGPSNELEKVAAPIEIPAVGHTEVDFTKVCEKGVMCSVCEEVLESEVEHTMVSAFGTKVEKAALTDHAGFNTLVVNNTAEDGIYYVDDSCVNGTVGYEAFEYCSVCYGAWDATKAKDLAWSLLTDVEDKMNYLFGAEGKVYNEGYKVIAIEHNMVDAFKDADKDGKLDNVIAPTCEVKGITANFQYCKDCSAMPENASIPQDKTYFDVVDAWATATKEVNGVKVPVNVVEGYTTVDALGHTWEYEDADGNIQTTYKAGKEATCTVDGTTWSATCKRDGCSYTKKADKISAFIHDGAKSATDKVVSVDFENEKSVLAVCGAQNYCGDCGEWWGNEGDHDLIKVADKAATCTEAGWKNMSYCADCDYFEAQYSYEAKQHKWEAKAADANTVEATCTTGVKGAHYYCDVCDTYGKASRYGVVECELEDIWTTAATGHTKAENFEAATCTTAAKNTVCAACKVDAFKEAALNHDYTSEPTCLANGKCVRCGEVEGTKLAHKYVPVDAKPATCYSDGYAEHHVCSECETLFWYDGVNYLTEVELTDDDQPEVIEVGIDKGEYLYLPKLVHDYSIEVAEVLSTCKVAGHSAYTQCTLCGDKDGYTEYRLATCASDIKSCADKVACTCAYLEVTLNKTTYVVDDEGYYVLDAETKLPKLVEEGTKDAVEAVWAGCGELTENTNKIDCVGHDTNGLCLVCGKEVAHTYEDGKCTVCKKEEPTA